MKNKFSEIYDEYLTIRKLLKENTVSEESLEQARALLAGIKESGRIIIDTKQRENLARMAQDLGEIIFSITGSFPAVGLDAIRDSQQLTGEIYFRCKEVFIQCPEFKTPRQLRSVFVSSMFFPFRGGLLVAETPEELADALLSYLADMRLLGKTPVLPLVIKELRDRHFSDEVLYSKLDAAFGAVQNFLKEKGELLSVQPNKKSISSDIETLQESEESLRSTNQRDVILMWLELIIDRYLYPVTKVKLSSNPLVTTLRQAVQSRDYQTIRHCLENSAIAGLSLSDFSEVHIQGARAAFYQQRIQTAERYLREGIARFGTTRFEVALSYWMLGCVLWSDPARSKEAIFYWNMCLGEMDELSRMLFPSREDLARYRTCLEEMKMALERAVQTSQLPPPSCLP